MSDLKPYLKFPLIAILRGITPEEVLDYGKILYNCGFRMIEVPVNSRKPFDSIQILQNKLPDDCLIGAGTVTTIEHVDALAETGAKLMVTPNVNAELIKHGVSRGLIPVPGFMTVSEAFVAIDAGATALKLFPVSSLDKSHLKSIKAILPPDVPVFPVGGIRPDQEQMNSYIQLGAKGFGLGSQLYQQGMGIGEFEQNAKDYAAVVQHLNL
jgi:2-dehydro-3-deoxyphosphogalactonate aldolase